MDQSQAVWLNRRLRETNRSSSIPPAVKALLAFSDLDDDALEEAVELLDPEAKR